jgi:hypothetical protein
VNERGYDLEAETRLSRRTDFPDSVPPRCPMIIQHPNGRHRCQSTWSYSRVTGNYEALHSTMGGRQTQQSTSPC